MNKKFDVKGMTCAACQSSVEKSVTNLKGINKCEVYLLSNSMKVDFDENITSVEDIINAVNNAGYSAFVSVNKRNNSYTKELEQMKKRLIYSFIFFIPLFYVTMGHMFGAPLPNFLVGMENSIYYAILQIILVIPIMVINKKYFIVGFKHLFKKNPNMDSLIAIGSLAAFIYGIFATTMIAIGLTNQNMDLVHKYHMDLYFESSGTILTLVTLGKYFETKSKLKTSDAIEKLIDLAPKTSLVLIDNEEKEINTEDLKINDIIIIKPGMRLPADGTIIEGSSSVDESFLSGEPLPVYKQVGSKVYAASINKQGYFKYKADKVNEDTTLAKIIKLVEEASNSKAPIAKLADKIASIFVPVVLAISLVTFIIWIFFESFEFSFSMAIAVLVISCPCALGLATPVAIMVATGKGAENGILIKSAEGLELLHSIDTVVFDKTGTLTEGKPTINKIYNHSNLLDEELLQIAASIESNSEHPLASAFIEECNNRNIEIKHIESFTSNTGKGVQGEYNNVLYYLGSAKYINELDIELPIQKNTNKSNTIIYLATKEKTLATFAIKDKIKRTSKAAISKLHKLNIKTLMLTGDNKITAESIKNEVGMDEAYAELQPHEKELMIKKLIESGHKVAMVGDGINDAPSLSRATVGIAIGAGTDIAIESANIILQRNDLLDVCSAIELSKATMKNIKMNLFWAFFYNSIGIPIAAGILYPLFTIKLNPMIGALAMSFSSVFVVTNALRLKLFKPTNIDDEEILEEDEEDEDFMKQVFIVDGMMCEHCAKRVSDAIEALQDGVKVKVNLKKKEVLVKSKEELSEEAVVSAVKKAGYKVIK